MSTNIFNINSTEQTVVIQSHLIYFRKSPKPNRRSLAMSEGSSRHSSPKHEPKGSDGHGKKGWTKDSTDGVSR